MTAWCDVCRFFPKAPGFDLCPKCLDLALEQGDDDVIRVPTAQLIFDFRGRPLFGRIERVEASERYL